MSCPIIKYGIKLLHLGLFGYLLVVPFLNSPKLLKHHTDLVIFLLIKWLIVNKCTLTKIESSLRTLDKPEDGIIYQFLQPIVDLKEHRFKWLIFTSVIILGLISYSKQR